MAESISLALRARLALEKQGFRFTHTLGQNFLQDEEVVEQIVSKAGVGEGANILEIGPGAGIMTGLMARRGARILAVELDRALAPVLESVLDGVSGVRMVYADAMKADLNGLVRETFGEGAPFSIVANLPYYITADFLMRAVRLQPAPVSITVMVQKEAAQRVMSSVGDKNWCALAATMQYFAETEKLMDAPASLFTPPPHVDSCLMRLTMKNERLLTGAREEEFLALIQTAFRMRRKTLANNLTSGLGISRETALAALEAAGVDARVRGEALELEQLARVQNALKAQT